MLIRQNNDVSIVHDLIIAAIFTAIILCAWVIIFLNFGDNSKFDTKFITFLGGVLAVSGLLFRQYMFKEVLDYLKSWEKMTEIFSHDFR